MFDSDGEGRQLEGFDPGDFVPVTKLVTGRRRGDADEDSGSLHEFNELVGPIRAFDGSATEASRIFPAVLQRRWRHELFVGLRASRAGRRHAVGSTAGVVPTDCTKRE